MGALKTRAKHSVVTLICWFGCGLAAASGVVGLADPGSTGTERIRGAVFLLLAIVFARTAGYLDGRRRR